MEDPERDEAERARTKETNRYASNLSPIEFFSSMGMRVLTDIVPASISCRSDGNRDKEIRIREIRRKVHGNTRVARNWLGAALIISHLCPAKSVNYLSLCPTGN
jgi:hypothetical protein